MKSIYKILGLTTAIALSFISCDENDGIRAANTTAPASTTNTGNFLFINATADGSPLNLFVNGVTAGGSVDLGKGQTLYTNIPLFTSGVTSTGTALANTSIRAKASSGGKIGGPLGSNDLIYRAGNTNVNNFLAANNGRYTLIALDSINRPAPVRTFSLNTITKALAADVTYYNQASGKQISNDQFKALTVGEQAKCVSLGTIPTGITDPGGVRFYLLTDTYPSDATIATAVTNNQSFIRFVHGAPNAPAVWVRLTPTATGSAIPIVSNVQYVMSVAGGFTPSVGSRAASAGFTTTATGAAGNSYTVEVSTDVNFAAIVVTVPNVTFVPGKIYTIVARGIVGKTGIATLGTAIAQHN
jgi:hypothetical protein